MRRIIIGICLAMAASVAAQTPSGQGAAAKLVQLHDGLHLTSDQEAVWADYAATVTPNPQAVARRQSVRQLSPGLPTPRRLALIDAAMTQDLADFREQKAAVLVLYGRLSPNQQRNFDAQTASPPATH
jgi:hypothetical protein